MKASLRHGSLVECLTHKRKRTWKTNVTQPNNKCIVCWAIWFADRTTSIIYDDDFADLCKVVNKFTAVKPSSVEFIEEHPDDES